MSDYSNFYEARDIVTDILKRDMIGPVSEDEIVTELPTQYYIMGKLYPQDSAQEVIDLVRNPFLENDVETYDASVSLSNQKNPSSMGITCTLKSGVNEILVTGSYAFYELTTSADILGRGNHKGKWANEESHPEEFWARHPYKFQQIIALGPSKVEDPVQLERGMQLQVYTHHIFEDGERILTVVLINTNTAVSKDVLETASFCAFQCEFRLNGIINRPVFADAGRQVHVTKDVELLELEMLYSDVHHFGQGHGCSVEWDMENLEPEWVSSSWFPTFNLHQMMAAQFADTQVLSMNYLSTACAEDLILSLVSVK